MERIEQVRRGRLQAERDKKHFLRSLSTNLLTLRSICFFRSGLIKTSVCSNFVHGAAEMAALPAYIVFPVYSGAVILLVNGIGAACFKERLTRREIIATAMIAAALVMLNI